MNLPAPYGSLKTLAVSNHTFHHKTKCSNLKSNLVIVISKAAPTSKYSANFGKSKSVKIKIHTQ